MMCRALPVCVVVILAVAFQSVAAVQAQGRRQGHPTRPPRPRRMGVITGIVSEAATGNPVRGAVVRAVPVGRVLDGADPTATTNANGRYRLRVPAGEYIVSVSKQGYQRQEVLKSVRPRQVAWVDFDLMEEGFGTVTGTVFSVSPDGTKKPLAGAEVAVYPHGILYPARSAQNTTPFAPEDDGRKRLSIAPSFHTKTDADGRFTFERVPVGKASVRAWRWWHDDGVEDITVLKDQTIQVELDLLKWMW